VRRNNQKPKKKPNHLVRGEKNERNKTLLTPTDQTSSHRAQVAKISQQC
jgi:hypothetical protein